MSGTQGEKVSKRKTSGKSKHFERVSLWLTVLFSKLEMFAYMFIHVENSLKGIPVHCVLQEMPCSNVNLFLVLVLEQVK